MALTSISELYGRVNEYVSTVYVVPLIKYRLPKTDYLYLLYKDLIENQNKIEVKSISVFNHFRFVLGGLFSKKTILHYHWVEFQDFQSLSAMPYKLLCIWMYALFGGRIVWTIHNLVPHDRKLPGMHKVIHRWMARKAALVHVHSAVVVDEVKDFLDIPESKIEVIPHPAFPAEFIEKPVAQQELLAAYGENRARLSDPVILVFGGLSEYKGIDEIVDILSETDAPFSLIIAGWIKKGQEKLHTHLFNISLEDERILYIPEFISDDFYSVLFNAADLCVFNYKHILTSGGVEMALAYRKKIIAPRKGTIIDHENDEDVILFEGFPELKEKLYAELNIEIDG